MQIGLEKHGLMVDENKRINLLGKPELQLANFFKELGEKPFRARQLLKWIHQRRVSHFDEMTDLSKNLRTRLSELAFIGMPNKISESRSADGTVKWIFDIDGKQAIETVFIPENNRGTLCISSQVGCVLDCSFCATGSQGFNRNLSTEEIIGQVAHANKFLPLRKNGLSAITNVVFMGMGEPLANYRSLIPALELLLSDYAYGISRRRITVSTSGIVPQIEKLSNDCNVSLAVSLHASNNDLRDQLVPINRVHPIEKLLIACWDYAKKRANRFITFEYVMLDNINDSLEDAINLINLMKGFPAKVNLIPFNPFPGTSYKCSSEKKIQNFQSRLHNSGIVTTIRRTRGADIDAACGQLAGKVRNKILTPLSEKNK